MKNYIFLVLLWAISFSSSAQSLHVPDSTFNLTGVVNDTACGIYYGKPDLLIQPDQKIVVCGVKNFRFAVMRFLPNGQRDAAFNGTGFTLVPGTGNPQALARQQDGKILIGGYKYGQYNDACLARIDSNGNRDLTFGDTGVVAVNLGLGDFHIFDLAIQPDGRILSSGWGQLNSTGVHYCMIMRFMPDGKLDTTFNHTGIDTFRVSDSYCIGFSMTLQQDKKILVAGTAETNLGTDSAFVLRLNPNGKLDATFGKKGIAKYHFSGFQSRAFGVLVQPDKKIVLGGTGSGNLNDFLVFRIDTSGALDAGFNSTGNNMVDFGGYDEAYSITRQSDGKIVLAGYNEFTLNNGFFALARFNTNGRVDSTFGTNGKVTKQLYLYSEKLWDVGVQSDGKIVAVGLTEDQTLFFDRTVILRLRAVNGSTDIDETSLPLSRVSMYPNPVADNLYLNYETVNGKEVKMEVVNMLGETVMSEPGKINEGVNTKRLNVKMLPAGVYILNITGADEQLSLKFVKE